MLTYNEFAILPENQQAQVLWLDGVYLELIRQTPELNVELYALYDFYVELYFDKTTEEPLRMNPFSNLKELDPYLGLLNITDVCELRNDGLMQ